MHVTKTNVTYTPGVVLHFSLTPCLVPDIWFSHVQHGKAKVVRSWGR